MAVVGVTGHRALAPEVEKFVRDELRRTLAHTPTHELTGISCIADGADAVFADVILELGGRLRVVVPARRYRADLPPDHQDHYDYLLRCAETVVELDREEADTTAFMAAGKTVVDAADQLVAVWDGRPARGHGGTAEVVAYAQASLVPVTVIWPEGVRRD